MAIRGKCLVKDCTLSFDDAEYIDDAVAKLRTHYRLDHPRKAFYEGRYLEDLEVWNTTLDEHIERYVGVGDWRNNARNHAHVIQACQQVVRYPQTYSAELIAEAEAIIVELGGQPQQPPNNGGNAPNIPFAQQVVGGVVQFDVDDDEVDPF